MNDSAFGSSPQDGSWKVAPANDKDGETEAFSMEFSSTLNSGEDYTLSFYYEGIPEGRYSGGIVEVGVSNGATSFGSLVYTSDQATTSWALGETTFSSPISADYLTFRLSTSEDYWVGIDNVSLVSAIPEPAYPGMVMVLFVAGSVFVRQRKGKLR